MSKEITYAEPPWSLKGNAYMLIYQFPESFVRDHGLIPPFLEGKFIGGPGAVIIVDYQASDVGPYGELLFIPGMFTVNGRKLFSITRIYVSTERSVMNGRRNWSIPKDRADFTFEPQSANRERVRVMHEGKTFFDATIQSSPLRLPVTSYLNPFPPSLIQQVDGNTHITTPGASGWVGLAKINSLQIDSQFFPDVSPFTPKVALRPLNVKLHFPRPEVVMESATHGH